MPHHFLTHRIGFSSCVSFAVFSRYAKTLVLVVGFIEFALLPLGGVGYLTYRLLTYLGPMYGVISGGFVGGFLLKLFVFPLLKLTGLEERFQVLTASLVLSALARLNWLWLSHWFKLILNHAWQSINGYKKWFC
jgi:hypothetical protein